MRVVIAVVLSAGIVFVAGQVDAQYRYTNDKGVRKVTQYKLDVPAPYRDAAVWIGPTGIGKPALSEEQRQVKQRDDAYRRIGETHARLAAPYKKVEAAPTAAQQHKAPDPTPRN
jgi:hypothetical protein